MKKLTLISGTVLLSTLLSACNYIDTKNESTHFYTIPEGSRLILNQPLTIEPEYASVLFQNGKQITNANIDIYKANCSFETYTLSKTKTIIQPDTFLITKVVDEMLSVSLEQLKFARLDFSMDGTLFAEGPSNYNYTTTMYLKSEKQPDVLRMSCTHWESILYDRYLTTEQVRQALGVVFTLKISP